MSKDAIIVIAISVVWFLILLVNQIFIERDRKK